MTGTVSLEAELKGINMGRIMRTFYDHKDEVTTGEWMGKVLKNYLRNIDSKDARLKISFSIRCCARACAAGSTAINSTTSPSKA